MPLRLIGAIMLGVSLYFCPNLIEVYDKDYPFLFRTEENKPFAIDRQKPEGAGFYSEGLSYKEFKVWWLISNPQTIWPIYLLVVIRSSGSADGHG